MFQSTPTSHEPISRPCLLLGGSAFVESFESDCQRRPAKWLKLAGTLRVLPGRSWFKRWREKKDRAGSNISLIFATIKTHSILTWGLLEEKNERKTWNTGLKGNLRKKTSIFMSQPWKHGTGNPLCPMRNCCPQRSSERIFTMERRNGVLHWNWTRVKTPNPGSKSVLSVHFQYTP